MMSVIMLSIDVLTVNRLSVVFFYCYAEGSYPE
jgi:hypothetical protein